MAVLIWGDMKHQKPMHTRSQAMTIVYLSSSTIPSRTANSIHVMKMCQAFTRLGHRTVLITPDTGEVGLDVSDVFAFYDVERIFRLLRLPRPSVRGRRYLFGLLAALRAKSLRPDLVYGRCLRSCFLASKLGVPVAYEAHATIEGTKRLTHEVHARLLRSPNLKRLVVISEALKRDYEDLYNVSAERIVVAHDGADEPARRAPLRLGRNGRLKVGYVGHLYPGKGMEVVSMLAQRCPWADVHVVGGRVEDVRYWKSQTKGIPNLMFHGFVPHAETDGYRASMDVLLAPYQRSVATSGGGSLDIAAWMSPLKLFEYMAAGKPIISSDLPVLREVLTHDCNAWLCPPDDTGRWVSALETLNRHPETRERLGEQARRDFLARHTWSARAQKLLEAIGDGGNTRRG